METRRPVHTASREAFTGFCQKPLSRIINMLSHTYVLSSEICISPCPHVSFLHSLSLSQIKLRWPITKHCPLLPVCFGKPSQRLCSTVHCAGWTPALGGTFVILPVLPIQNQFGHNTSLHLALPYLSGQSSCFSRCFPSQRNAHVYQFPSTGCYYKTQTPELTTPVISSLFIVKLYVFFYHPFGLFAHGWLAQLRATAYKWKHCF